jgi:chromosomal replication initiation ATPase DnaA
MIDIDINSYVDRICLELDIVPNVIQHQMLERILVEYKEQIVHPPKRPDPEGSIDHIIEAACHVMRVPQHELFSTHRTRRISRTRWVICHIARTTTDLSLPEIARELHLMDHTSVMHGLKRVNMEDVERVQTHLDQQTNEK